MLETLEKAVQEGAVMGAVVVARGTVEYRHAVGHRALAPAARPMEKDTVFVMASMTKLVTTIAALQLVERGLLALDQDVSPQLPVLAGQPLLTGFGDDGVPLLKMREKPITLRHLLTHSFGGSYDFLSSDIARYRRHLGIDAVQGTTVEELFATPLLYEPGDSWTYGGGLDWTGKLIEKVAGMSLDHYTKRYILEPLGLKDMTFWPAAHPDMADRMARMTIRGPQGGRAVESRRQFELAPGVSEACGGQGLYATATDYAALLHSLLVDDERLLKKETAALMFEPQLSPAAKAALNKAFKQPGWAVGHHPAGVYDWGLGGLLVDNDDQSNRKRGTLLWGGSINSSWFLDRATGVCGVFGCNLLPPADVQIEKLLKAFEDDVYARAAAKARL